MKTKISYASEEGLKELYRRAVSRIPDVDTELDYYSENPIANSTVTNALANLASYLVVPGTSSDHHPNIPSGTESEMVLYFVKVASRPGKDNYKEWIWTGKWECIGEPSIVVDDALNINSMNPITNHAVTEALLNFGGFEKVNGTGADNHPDVANPSTKVIYLVEVPGTPEPDHCMEWIWEASGKWVCIGSTSIEVDTELDPSSDNPVSNGAVCGGLAEKTDKEEFEATVGTLNDEIALKADQSGVDTAVNRLEGSISDLSTHVEGEIGDLDTAKANKDELAITPGTGSDADKATIQLKANTSITVLTVHQDISGKADCATTLAGYGITDAKIENTASNTVVTLGSNTLTVGLSDGRVNAIDGHTLFAERATNSANGTEIDPNLIPARPNRAGEILTLSGTAPVWSEDEFIDVTFPETELIIGGKSYPLVTIGNLVWMAENLDYAFDGITIVSNSTKSSTDKYGYYYNDNESTYGYTGYKYGIYYNLPSVQYLVDNIDNIAPGWRIPTKADFVALAEYIGCTVSSTSATQIIYTGPVETLRATDSDWRSGTVTTDTTGFHAVSSGDVNTGPWTNAYNCAYYWCSTISSSYRNFVWLNNDNTLNIVMPDYNNTKSKSIRLVKDA